MDAIARGLELLKLEGLGFSQAEPRSDKGKHHNYPKNREKWQ
ncbi:MAG TPA: hypothetical protein VK253_08130 [Candidatus Binatia bacterium]|nr:hypothetical protein [Candidatus Binatia bacterium]